MDKDLKKILMDFSMKLHEWEEKNPKKDMPAQVDGIWMKVTAILENEKTKKR